MYNYKCEKCGCSLDPGEGNFCDECKVKNKIINVKGSIGIVGSGVSSIFNSAMAYQTRTHAFLENKKHELRIILKDVYDYKDSDVDIVDKMIFKQNGNWFQTINIYETLINIALKGDSEKVGTIDGISSTLQQI